MVSDFERRDPASSQLSQRSRPHDRTPASGWSEESAAEGDDAVHAQYWIPGAGQMTWSGLPSIRSGRVFGGVATPVQQLDSAELSQWHTRRRHLDEQPVHIHRRWLGIWRRADLFAQGVCASATRATPRTPE